jgi:hypothetical protein
MGLVGVRMFVYDWLSRDLIAHPVNLTILDLSVVKVYQGSW